MVTIYNVISKDGFIARSDGGEDFIPEEIWEYDMQFFRQFDTWVMGRKTYEAIQKYDEESKKLFDGLNIQKIIVTENKDFQAKDGIVIAHSIADAIHTGKNILICSGPTLNTNALKQNFVNNVIQYKLSDEISEGIRPFSIDTKNILKKIKEESAKFGVITAYKITKI